MVSWPVVSDVEETISKANPYDGVEIDLHSFVKIGTSTERVDSDKTPFLPSCIPTAEATSAWACPFVSENYTSHTSRALACSSSQWSTDLRLNTRSRRL